MRHIKDTRQYSRHERPQTAVSGHRQPHPADSGGGVCWARLACRYHALRLRASPRLFIFLHARTQSMYKWFAISIPGQGAHCRCENCVPRVAFTLPPEATQSRDRDMCVCKVLHFVLPNASASHMQAHSHMSILTHAAHSMPSRTSCPQHPQGSVDGVRCGCGLNPH